MSKAITESTQSALQTITRLLEISKLDTLYRDLYFQRARALLQPLLSPSTYAHRKESLASLEWTERQLRSAVERGDWKRSGELTERIRATRSSASASGELLKLGEVVYEGLADIPMDPFSPGFHVFVKSSTDELLQSRARANQILTTLERTDSSKGDFYKRRRSDFEALSIKRTGQQQVEKTTSSGPGELQQEALSALEAGDLSRLELLVQKLMAKPAVKETTQKSVSVEPTEMTNLGEDLLFAFSDETISAAKRLGLAPARTKSRRHFAHLIPHGWQPSFMKSESRQWSKDQISRLTFPSETSDKGRDAIEFFLLNAFMTSGGTRYQVCLVVEDLLLEDFAEPEPKEDVPLTPLLSALGLENRRGVSRIDIENAVLQYGPNIIEKELALDPEVFRLVAIPADIYTHLGGERGWGQKEMWTHFDGYRVFEGGKVQGLAGGDKRFGGTHDVVSFNTAYTKETIIARFAVVQRKRMMTWHQK
jgi:hypothetical protein